MGVKGLWQLLEPVGKPVTLESLQGKVLSVDASILINQSVKGMRDKDGNPLPNAHLVGLFHRLCKLLFFGIKPVFVFDGGVPVLKKRTLVTGKGGNHDHRAFVRDGVSMNVIGETCCSVAAYFYQPIKMRTNYKQEITSQLVRLLIGWSGNHSADARRERRFKARHGSNKAAERIIKNYLKGKALESVTGRKSDTSLKSSLPIEPDMFALPPLPVQDNTQDSSSSEGEYDDSPLLEQYVAQTNMEDEFQDPSAVDVESADFKALPEEIQHELIIEMKEARRWKQQVNMPEKGTDFSAFQLQGVLQRGRLTQRLDQLRNDMNTRSSGEVSGVVPEGTMDSESSVVSRRIVSEDTGHYLLLKGSTKAKESKGTLIDNSTEGGFFRETEEEDQCTTFTAQTRYLEKPKKQERVQVPNFEVPHMESSDSEVTSPTLEVPDNIVLLTRESEKLQQTHVPRSNEDVLVRDNKTIYESDTSCSEVIVPSTGNTGVLLESVDQLNENTCSFDSEIVKRRRKIELLLESRKLVTGAIDHDTYPLNETQRVAEGNGNMNTKVLGQHLLDEELSSRDLQSPHSNGRSSTDDGGKGASGEGTSSDADFRAAEGFSLQLDISDESAEEEESGVTGDEEESSQHETTPEKGPLVMDLPGVIEGDTVLAKTALYGGDSKMAIINDMMAETRNDGKEEHIMSEDDVVQIKESSKELELEKSVDNISEEKETSERTKQRANDDIVKDQEQPSTSSAAAPALSEFAGSSKEELQQVQAQLRAEQRVLESERARQARASATVSNEMLIESQELLQLFGVPFLVSPMEAEAQCAFLDMTGQTDGTITDDSDVFLFGGRLVYKNIFNQKKHAECYSEEAINKHLALDRSKMIKLAFITGSDYTEGVQGLGAVGGMEVLQEFNDEGFVALEKLKKWHKEALEQGVTKHETRIKTKLRTVSLSTGFPSREVYDTYMSPVVDESRDRFEWARPDLHGLRLFALDKLAWSSSRTDELVLPVMKQLSQQTSQTTMERFFEIKFQETRKSHSKRVRRVVNRLRNPSSSSGLSSDEEDGQIQVTRSADICNKSPGGGGGKRVRKSRQTNSTDRTRRTCDQQVTMRSSRKGRGRGRGNIAATSRTNGTKARVSSGHGHASRTLAKKASVEACSPDSLGFAYDMDSESDEEMARMLDVAENSQKSNRVLDANKQYENKNTPDKDRNVGKSKLKNQSPGKRALRGAAVSRQSEKRPRTCNRAPRDMENSQKSESSGQHRDVSDDYSTSSDSESEIERYPHVSSGGKTVSVVRRGRLKGKTRGVSRGINR